MTGWQARRGDATVSRVPSPTPPTRWLRLIGEFSVRDAARQWTATEMGSRKARVLLAVLAVEDGRLVSVTRAVELLWGNAVPRRPVESVATLVSRLRARLGSDVVVGTQNAGYRLGPSISVDLFEAARQLTAAEVLWASGDAERALAGARLALALLSCGVVLPDQPHAHWATVARGRHTTLLRGARLLVSELALHLGDVRLAHEAADAAVVADPMDEAAHRALMLACHAGDEPARALAAFEQLRGALADELGVPPAPLTRKVHLAILRNDDPVHEAVRRDRSA